MNSFKELTLEDKELFESFFKGKYRNSEASFTNLYIWKDYYDTHYTIHKGFLVIINKSPYGGYHCYYPYGEGDIKSCLSDIYDYTKSIGEPLRITNASEESSLLIKEIFPDAKVKENIDFNDYVYRTEALATLSGKKLHSKKNHLNRFKKMYERYAYREIRPEDYEACIALASRLILKDKDESDYRYIYEMKSIRSAFENFCKFGLKGGLIEIDKNIAAFTVGEELTKDCALIHIEKADTSYDGIYAAINNEFVINTWMDFEYVNREEDMGIEGLRKAKMSYKPEFMVKKFKCVVD